MTNIFEKFTAECREAFDEAIDDALIDFWGKISPLMGISLDSADPALFLEAAEAALAWLRRPEAARFARLLDAMAGNGRQDAEDALGKLKDIFHAARDIAEWTISHEKDGKA